MLHLQIQHWHLNKLRAEGALGLSFIMRTKIFLSVPQRLGLLFLDWDYVKVQPLAARESGKVILNFVPLHWRIRKKDRNAVSSTKRACHHIQKK